MAYDYSQDQGPDVYKESKVRGGNRAKEDITGQGLNMNRKPTNSQAPSKQGKMEADLNIVIDNIVLTNEIINNCVTERRIDE